MAVGRGAQDTAVDGAGRRGGGAGGRAGVGKRGHTRVTATRHRSLFAPRRCESVVSARCMQQCGIRWACCSGNNAHEKCCCRAVSLVSICCPSLELLSRPIVGVLRICVWYKTDRQAANFTVGTRGRIARHDRGQAPPVPLFGGNLFGGFDADAPATARRTSWTTTVHGNFASVITSLPRWSTTPSNRHAARRAISNTLIRKPKCHRAERKKTRPRRSSSRCSITSPRG